MPSRLVVGLTGTFGSGKSTVGRLLKRMGARRVIDCDRLVDEAFRPRHPVRRQIESLFDSTRRISRKSIAQVVFSNPHKRKKLESLVHPFVFYRIASELKRVPDGIIILEAPLLFETDLHRSCDVTVAVTAGERRIVRRLARAGFGVAQVRARLRAQLPEVGKKRRASLSIVNFGSKRLLERKVKALWQKLSRVHNQMLEKELRSKNDKR